MRKFLILAGLCPLMSLGQSPSFTQFKSGAPPLGPTNNLLKPLAVGDKLPPAALALLRRSQKAGAGPPALTLLDFWATWCTACLSSMRTVDSLSRQFGPRVAAVLVNAKSTRDNPKKVAAFLQAHRRPDGSKFDLPVLHGDTVFNALFPHRLIPHAVWLNADGRVLAITDHHQVTAANVSAALEGRLPRLPVKADVFDYDPEKPLLQAGNGGSAPAVATVFSGKLEGLNTTSIRRTTGDRKKRVYINFSAFSLYRQTLSLPANRIRFEAPDSLRQAAFLNRTAPGGAVYSLEITVPVATAEEEVSRLALQCLNANLGFWGRWERRAVPCWVLRLGGGAVSTTKGGARFTRWGAGDTASTTLQNVPLSLLMGVLNTTAASGSQNPVVLNETGLATHLDLEIRAPLTNLPALARELKRHGLSLEPAVRELPFFVISPAPTGEAGQNQ